jgi:arylsulfatase A-like enzyme/predicted negative regulator of RcsB-dependent stress response
LLIGGLAAVACLVGLGLWMRRSPPPNIVFITLDTTRADRLGCYGYEKAETPHLDALARRGTLFERAYAPAPMTTPSHSSMFTGLWPPEHGVITNGQMALPRSIPSLADLLAKGGYDTGAFVAAFVLQKKFGLARGFKVYDDDLSQAERNSDELHRYRDGRLVVDAAVKWLEGRAARSAGQPFFCWVHLYDAHDPYMDHADKFGDRFKDRPYDAELAYVDGQVGRLFALLESLKLAENTVVVVVGDHGESLGEHHEQTHGYMLHESTLRVPLIIANPRGDGTARRVADPVPLVDLFPTMLELGGGRPGRGISGKSLVPALAGSPLESRTCYSRTEEPFMQAFWSPLQGLTTENWRYVRTTRPELYDLKKDPRELVNLADDQPEKLRELEEELARFESGLTKRAGAIVAVTPEERRALESMGYTGGGRPSSERPEGESKLPDIKDMIGSLNSLHEATELMDEKKFDEAAKILEPLARDVPNMFRAGLNLARCRMHQENYEDAIRWSKSALEVDPNSDRAHDMLGFCYLKLNKLNLAAEHFQRLLEINPDSENGLQFLGEIHQRQGNTAMAMRYYEAALRVNPNNDAAAQALMALRRQQ